MIKRTLIVSLQEQDPVTKVNHDILRVMRGNSDETVVLEPAIQGKMIVEKSDLSKAILEVETFYKNELPTPTPAIDTDQKDHFFEVTHIDEV